MLTHSEYLSIIERSIAEIEYPSEPAGLYGPIAYTLEGGGKRLRPVLVLAAADAFGLSAEKAVNQALAVEVFHNFTLLHDDVMDRADMRRGRPTVHVKWNDRTAILSGDAMLTVASMLVVRGVAPDKAVRLAALLNRTAMEVYEGQQMDMDFESMTEVSVDDYLTMIRLKTSVLLGCAAALGAMTAGASDQSVSAMYAFGEKLGLAFQLRDDYLDTFGDPIIFGKEIGGDILNDKKTWLLITAMKEDATGALAKLIASPPSDAEKIEAVRDVYNRLDLARRCNDLIDRYIDDAIAELDRLDITPAAKNFFAGLAENSRSRLH